RSEDERWHVRKDGSQFWAMGVVTPLWDDSGALRGYAKIMRDITERMRAEMDLTESNRRKDEFLAMLAHELRNPLAPIVNGLHVLRLDGLERQLGEQARAMIERQTQHLTRLVDDLLDVSRITRGRVQVRQQRLDLTQLVRTTAEDRRTVAEQAGMQLRVTVPQQPVWVAGDPVRLTQVLNNLLDNAVKFRDGGVKVD